MKVVHSACKLQWVFLDEPGKVIERPFDGTAEEATEFLQQEASRGKRLFGHVLRNDGYILANVASMGDLTAKLSMSSV